MKIKNLEMNVRIAGQGMPFLWAHGLLGSMAFEDQTDWFDWDSLSSIARVVRYDARGHGQSDATYVAEDYLWSNLAIDMLSLADSLNINTFVAGGKSMGCGTSLYAALLAPERVKGMVLVNPPTAWETRKAQASNYEKMAAIIESRGVPALVEILRKRQTLPQWLIRERPELSQFYTNRYNMFDARTLATILRAAKQCDFPQREHLKMLKMPVLILAWADDVVHPLESAKELSALLPASRLVISDNAADVKGWSNIIRQFVISLASKRENTSPGQRI